MLVLRVVARRCPSSSVVLLLIIVVVVVVVRSRLIVLSLELVLISLVLMVQLIIVATVWSLVAFVLGTMAPGPLCRRNLSIIEWPFARAAARGAARARGPAAAAGFASCCRLLCTRCDEPNQSVKEADLHGEAAKPPPYLVEVATSCVCARARGTWRSQRPACADSVAVDSP